MPPQTSALIHFLAGWPATLGLFLAGLLLAWPRDWRLGLLALTALYTLAGVHLASLTQPEVAPAHLLTGGLVASSLWLAATRAPRRKHLSAAAPPAGSGLLRLAATLLLATGAAAVGWTYGLPGLTASQAVASLWLLGLGLLALAGHEVGSLPGAAGVLLLLLAGEFPLLAVSRSLALAAGLLGLHLLLAATLAALQEAAPLPGSQP